MITNYLKLAIRVLGRNKFFTAITLFGISFTMAILMLIVSLLETEIGKTPPLTKKNRLVVVPSLELKRQFYDTIYAYDTLIVKGEFTVDTTYKLEDSGTNNSNNEFAYWFLEKHLNDIPHAVNQTFFNTKNSFNAYVNNTKVEMNVVYTDHGFWEVFDFKFVEGFGFSESVVDQGEQVAVITTELADEYFGRKENVLNEEIEMDGKSFRVMGVIEPAGVSLLALDLIVPFTLNPAQDRRNEYGFGGYFAAYLAESSSSVPLLKQDIEFINDQTEVPAIAQGDFDIITFTPYSYYEAYSSTLLDDMEPEESLVVMKWVMIALLSFFILLPTLNLINLNVSRMLERSSEIGVRKAFGANNSVILGQFVIENVVQTLLGGLIGLGLALVLMYIINDTKLIGEIILKVNYRFYFFSFLICILFGIVSGLLPAYRMSRLHVVNALKSI